MGLEKCSFWAEGRETHGLDNKTKQQKQKEKTRKGGSSAARKEGGNYAREAAREHEARKDLMN